MRPNTNRNELLELCKLNKDLTDTETTTQGFNKILRKLHAESLKQAHYCKTCFVCKNYID